MSDTLFADISEFQPDVTDAYPYQFISIRSNDGTYVDHHFAANLAWSKHRTDTGKLAGFLVYFVFEDNWQQTLATFKAAVGTPHPKMAVMLDVESWAGKISGDHSVAINAVREAVISWLGGNRRRVIGYANAGDFASIWPTRGDTRVVLANYSSNPVFPGKIAHQFADNYPVPPFGNCDINSADGYSPQQFAIALGLTNPAPTPNTPPPAPPSPPAVTGTDRLVAGQALLAGHTLTARDGSHTLHLQTDGNLVLYHGTKALWATHTSTGASLHMQPDGNVVLYDAHNKPLWDTHTAGSGAAYLVCQTDGNVVAYTRAGHPVWQSKTAGR